MTCVQWCISGLFSPSLDNYCLNLSIGGQPILCHCICWLQLELWILQILKKKYFFLFLVAFLHKRLKWSQDHLAVFLSAVQFQQEGTFRSVECLQSVLCVGTNTHAHKQCVGGCEDNKVMTKRDCWSVCSACEAQRFLWTPAFSLCICVSTVDPINWINRPVWLWCQRRFCLEQKAPHPSAWHCYAKDQKIQRMLMLTHLKLI